MKAFYCDHFVLPLPKDHRFPAAKYRLLREAIAADPALAGVELLVPAAASAEAILRVHTREYFERLIPGTLSPDEVRRIGFPWSPQLVERARRSVGGTLAASSAAWGDGFAARGDGFAARGDGFAAWGDGFAAWGDGFAAWGDGIAVNLAGGTHHAFAGEGPRNRGDGAGAGARRTTRRRIRRPIE